MVIHRDIKFETDPPAVETFTSKINEITGIEVIYDEFEVFNPYLRKDSFYYSFDGNTISLTIMGALHVNYLLGVGLYALVQLGGDFGDGFIPAWASLKWEDIKNRVDRLPGYPI